MSGEKPGPKPWREAAGAVREGQVPDQPAEVGRGRRQGPLPAPSGKARSLSGLERPRHPVRVLLGGEASLEGREAQ